MSQLPVELAWRLAERAEEHRWLVVGLWAEQDLDVDMLLVAPFMWAGWQARLPCGRCG